MAKRTLYGNHNEPEFPFLKVGANLEWLERDCSHRENARGTDFDYFTSVLDTVLVWTRARTAAFLRTCPYHECRSLALLLNATLEEAGDCHHRLELVPFGRWHFFVTCRNSPRFNWKTRLTHLEIGRNIDYSAPGHYGPLHGPSVPRATVYFFERTSYKLLSAECAYYQSLEDIDAKRQWLIFNHAKEQLYNDTMARLGLKYRFKCVFEFPNTSQEVHSVMIRSDPPTAEWWDENCAHLLAIGELGKPRSCVFFCNFQTRYDEYWELIRCVYSFGLKYFSLDMGKVTTHCGFDLKKDAYGCQRGLS